MCGIHILSLCAQTLSLELMSYMKVAVGLSLFILFFPSFLDLSIEVEMSILHGYQAFDDLFATVAFLLQSNPSSVFITTYHNRRYISIFFSCFRFIEGLFSCVLSSFGGLDDPISEGNVSSNCFKQCVAGIT